MHTQKQRPTYTPRQTDSQGVLLRQSVLGIRMKIMLPWDTRDKTGPKKLLSDHVSIVKAKGEILPTTSISEQKGGKLEPPACYAPVSTHSITGSPWQLDL